MAIEIIVTTAGRAALVNAVNTGTNAVTITQLGITDAVFVPDAAQVALPGEIKRIASVAGVVVADDQIHVTASDVTTDAYTMRGFALYLNDGTLFAIYGQPGAILNKTAESMMLLAVDIAFADIDAELIEFGDTNFVLPPATTEILGLVELATTAEAQAGADAQRALTPLTSKQSVLGWLLSQDGSGSGLDADLLDGLHANAFSLAGHTHDRTALTGFGTMAAQNANAVAIAGGTIDATPIGNIAPSTGKFTTITATAAGAGDVARFSAAGSQALHIYTDVNTIGLFNVAGAGVGRDGIRISDGSVAFDIAAAEVVRLEAGGLFPSAPNAKDLGWSGGGEWRNVRIGGTFSINNTADAARGLSLSVTGAAGTGVANISTTSSGYALGFGVDGVERARIGTNGHLGIGTNNPQLRLHVKSSAEIARYETATARGSGNGFVGIGDPSGRKGWWGYGGGNDVIYLMNDLNASLILGNGGQARLILDTSGHLTPNSHGSQILGWPTVAWKEGHFTDLVRVAGNNVWHSGNDGSGSGLDADLLDGQQGAYYLPAGSYTAADVLAKLNGVDGPGSGLDADLLDGQQGAYYLPAASYTAADVLGKLVGVDGAGSGLDADLLDGRHASEFVLGSSFAASFAQNGYQVLPNGLIIQWGRFSAFANQYTNASLPVTFPNQAFSAVVAGVAGGGADSQDNAPSITSLSTSQIQVFSADNSTTTMHFIAIGY